MKLKPKSQSLAPVKMRITLPGELHQDLAAYAEHYRETYGEAITAEALAVEMLAQFIRADAGFRRWKAAKGGQAVKTTDPVVGQRQEEPPAQPERQPFSSIHRAGGDN
ncbi:MAG: DUF2274 domain-containing protein [Pseudomonadota bacterium]|nr:DUF2274 domain-containing protein [Pseudomonadota bacterium]